MDLSPDDEDFQGRLLHQACLWDNAELVRELLSAGADVEASDERGRRALHAATLHADSRSLRVLIDAGACLDAVGDASTGGKTALHIAAERGHVGNVRALLAAGASETADAAGDSALQLAARGGHRLVARVLTEAREAADRERLSRHAALRALVAAGDAGALGAALAALGPRAAPLANMTPGGAHTLLYLASEAGDVSLVHALLSYGADGRAHPVTRYGPLHGAASRGHAQVARALLDHCPRAAKMESVEKWLPLHAAVIGGHAALVTLLLEYPYPEDVLETYTFTDATGASWQYSSAFDVNAVDASGQSALCVAATLGNAAVADALLAHTRPASPLARTQGDQHAPRPEAQAEAEAEAGKDSPARSGIALGIHAIVAKLSGAGVGQRREESCADRARMRVVVVDDGSVACAARGGHVAVLRRLLAEGAKADAPAPPPDIEASSSRVVGRRSRSACPSGARASPAPSPARGLDDRLGVGVGGGGGWTALALAARGGHSACVELLLAHGASDPHHLALGECVRHNLAPMVAMLLHHKAHVDPEYKLNKEALSALVFGGDGASARAGSGGGGDSSALTYRALVPTHPVAVAWRDLRCPIAPLRMSWLRGAALRVNPSLSGSAGAGASAMLLHAITRLDVANNELRDLPPEIFTMLSLRYLNAAQNKLERLPSPSDPFEEELDSKGRRTSTGRPARKARPALYSAPVLHEIYLQDNRLEELPPELFSLPSLTTLDVSNNKLRALPAAVWRAPRLRELRAQLNHLKDLPKAQGDPESSPRGPRGAPAAAARPPSQPPQPPQPHSAGTSPSASHFAFPSRSVSSSSSRSPSIECSVTETEDDADDVTPTLGDRGPHAVCSEARRVHGWRGAVEPADPPPPLAAAARGPSPSPLTSLNLAHNQFACVPAVLACLAPHLQHLNMAYNSLRSMSYVTSYPTSLRQLDLSHNEITCWPSLPQVDTFLSGEDPLACYCASSGARPRPRSCGGALGPSAATKGSASMRAQLLAAACPARRHLRLEGLRTLILANNLLTRIQLTTDDDGDSDVTRQTATQDNATDAEDDEWGSGSAAKSRLVFPLLSMLDVSCNLLRAIPPAISHLANLAVLNISGNKEITELPPQMGLLSRLWNLSTAGCALAEPLASMVAGGRYRSMDVVGYLKSVLQEAHHYRRMKLMLVGLQGIGKTSLLECLRQESAIHHRRKSTDHWAKRMGNKGSRRNMSTVGVDIGAWTYEGARGGKGPVTFRTWDFGGQHEYYATHQYFLSRRSLYLVVWRASDGKRGLAGAVSWLRSIQARAPGAPVILVATHYDQVSSCPLPASESLPALQRAIRSTLMVGDADKLGLPRVMDSVEVSCLTKHNIRLLADIIYSVAFSVKPPGGKQPLLEQQVPATYLALEEVVTQLAQQLPEPVVRHAEYKRLVSLGMARRGRSFRDPAELLQATAFLHENGVLLHYDDATLKELYFLRPQWLCDVLAHVVSVREVNPFGAGGVMRVEDLAHVLKASPALQGPDHDAPALALSLLNKFELALCWDARVLLIPPLLPAQEPEGGAPQLLLRTRGGAGTIAGATGPASEPPILHDGDIEVGARGGCSGAGGALRRVLLLSYVPCGFWPRLVTRVLADAALATAADAYSPPPELEGVEAVRRALSLPWGWQLWRSGLKLVCGELTLLAVRELPPRGDPLLGPDACDEPAPHSIYHNVSLRVSLEGARLSLEPAASACVEISLPAQVCVLRRRDRLPIAGYQSISLEPNPETLARLLGALADHVDLLLEDWYPALGTRFVHTSEGRCLITRVVPCPGCLRDATANCHGDSDRVAVTDDEEKVAQALRGVEMCAGAGGDASVSRSRVSQESRASDGDSGVGHGSGASSRVGSVEGSGSLRPPPALATATTTAEVTAWSVEECILCACTQRAIACASHPDVRLADVAPDTLLLDVPADRRARWEHIALGGVAGRGAFGTVLRGAWLQGGRGARGGKGTPTPVAVKALQPVAPPSGSDQQAQQAYKAALGRWSRDPLAAACRAYVGLRQELSILARLRHAHVAALRAVCAAPLALLLELAPLGSLEGVLRARRSLGLRLSAGEVRALALQVARALEYLHARRIVYRDLKSENVLVWSMPPPGGAGGDDSGRSVLVKLGDYGISRLAPPSGTKGFGGTEGFMAPEILRYNGEEEYTEKVDCFSYGMLLYELMTLRQPFEGHEAVKECVLDGARPALTPRDLEYPCVLLETMRRCWCGAAGARPAAAALVALAAAPEGPALQDAAQAPHVGPAAAVLLAGTEESPPSWEVWLAAEDRIHTLGASPHAFTHAHALRASCPARVTALCAVGATLWAGDERAHVSVFDVATGRLMWTDSVLASVGGAPCAVSALVALPGLRRVAVALAPGRLFLVTSSRPPPGGGFVCTELGAATQLNALVAVLSGDVVQLWAGGEALASYALTPGGVAAADQVPLPAKPAGAVALLAAQHQRAVVAYCSPGSHVYQYCVSSKRLLAKLDCSKLAPCSESIDSIAVDDIKDQEFVVTALCCVEGCNANGSGGLVVAATGGGVVVVADSALRPLTVFRPYERDCCAALVLPPCQEGQPPMLATLGVGYRPLVPRHAPLSSASAAAASTTVAGPHCLLWRTQYWHD